MIVAILFLVSAAAMGLPTWVRDTLALSSASCTYQLLTYALLHANFPHLAGNFALAAVPGMLVETSRGWKRTALYCALMAVAAGAAHVLTIPSVMGAVPLIGFSGVTFGLITLSALVAAEEHHYVLGGVLATAVCSLVLLEANAMSAPDFVSHAGHVGGALAGLVLYGLDRQVGRS